MNMNIKQSTLAAAVTAALAMGMSGQAAAYIYAGAVDPIDSLKITFTPSNTKPTDYTFTVSNSATLQGAPVATSGTCSGTSGGATGCSLVTPVLAAGAANGTGSNLPAAQASDYSLSGPNALYTYANANSAIQTAELVQGSPTTVDQVSEVQIQNSGNAQANTAVSSNTTIIFDFTVGPGGPGTFDIKFNASPFMQTYFNNSLNLLPGTFASAQLSLSISLASANGTSIVWAPNGLGTGADTCTSATCTATDPISLNTNISWLGGNPESHTFGGAGPYAFELFATGLAQGTYKLELDTTTFAKAGQTVPEPASLALLGIGLAGIGFISRRRKA